MKIKADYFSQPIISVMLVEDNKADQYLFTEALSNVKNTRLFGIAENGVEALMKIEQSIQLPNIIFSDITMPVMDGIELLEKLLNNNRTKNIPVIILSSATEQANFVCSKGARVFIKKPINAEILRVQIDVVVNSNFLAFSNSYNNLLQEEYFIQ
jgi:CheY-like chemotaxis protein